MKNIIFVAALFLISCNQSSNESVNLQKRVDSLQTALHQSYKPGLGEFMSQVQVHHAKLWFAGKYGNWPLAEFEVGEIQEALDDIPKFCSDRPEVKSIGIIDPAMDSISAAIKAKDETRFDSSFTLLTATCNDCHKATNHGFNLIKTPDIPPVSNQVFRPQ